MGSPMARGYPNLCGILQDASIHTQDGLVTARSFFYELEKAQMKMTVDHRSYLLKCLDPQALKRYPLEFPFRVGSHPDYGQTAIEIYYGSDRFLVYSETIDTVGLQQLIRHQRIPKDSSDPMLHIVPHLIVSRQEMMA